MAKYLKFFKINKSLIIYFLFIFLATRFSLITIGLMARVYPPQQLSNTELYYHFSDHPWLNLWGIWDSSWYVDIAQNGYSTRTNSLDQGTIGFFPLYPLTIKLFAVLTKNHYLAGILVSNISLFLASYFLYHLIKLEDDHATSLRGIKYLFLHPAAFIFSGVFSESLFLALLIACFFWAKKKNWGRVGMSGFLLSLTKPTGFLIFFIMLTEYLKGSKFKIQKMDYKILYLLLIPLGIIFFLVYTHSLSGSWLAYLDNKIVGWGLKYTNPLITIINVLKMNNLFRYTIGLTSIVGVFFLTIFYKKIGFNYWILGIVTTILPLMVGFSSSMSLLRQTLVIFPLYIILAKITKNFYIDLILTIVLIATQLWALAYWVNGLYIV